MAVSRAEQIPQQDQNPPNREYHLAGSGDTEVRVLYGVPGATQRVVNDLVTASARWEMSRGYSLASN